MATLAQMLEQTFPEFRTVEDKRKVHWHKTWSGHTARYLAEKSAHPLREDQYRLMFVTWSEQAHGAPAASMENLFPRSVAVGEVVAADDARIAETVTMAITLFLELWMLLPHVPQVDPMQRLALDDGAAGGGAPARRAGAAERARRRRLVSRPRSRKAPLRPMAAAARRRQRRARRGCA